MRFPIGDYYMEKISVCTKSKEKAYKMLDLLRAELDKIPDDAWKPCVPYQYSLCTSYVEDSQKEQPL